MFIVLSQVSDGPTDLHLLSSVGVGALAINQRPDVSPQFLYSVDTVSL